jgi:serine/threonine protein kinase/Tol biopolymer transport system component
MPVGTPRHSLARFEEFVLNLRTGELCHDDGKVIRLREQSFQILVMLLERPGEVVGREELRTRLWPNDTVVEFEHSISAAMNRLRQALGDSATDPTYIETLARRGYRWMRSVEWVDNDKNLIPAEESPGPPALPPSNLTGSKVSHYRVLTLLGGGGMGLVYKAEDLKLNRPVALKFLPEELASDSLAIQRFEREARAASALNHPNICTIHGVEEYAGGPFIVMELLEGDSLRELAARYSGPGRGTSHMPLQLLLEIAVQIAAGLGAAHEKGIVHRDIKPANIFATTRGQVKILDFGLAEVAIRQTDATSDSHPVEGKNNSQPSSRHEAGIESTLSRTGVAMGTAGYMSPEQVRGEKLDARTDLFSFGLVLFEMATAQRAFNGDTATIVHNAILHETLPPVRQLNPELPLKLEQIIAKALEKDRGSRYQTAAEMLTDLKTIQSAAAQAVAPLYQDRDVLGDSAESPPYVKTVPRRGDQFIDQIQRAHSEDALATGKDLPSRSSFGKVGTFVLIGAGLLAVALAFLGWRLISAKVVRSSLVRSASANLHIVPLTKLPGAVRDPAFSPDGEKFAFFWNGERPANRFDLYVQLVGADKPLRLTNTIDPHGYMCCADWSPDGQKIAFSKCGDYRGEVLVIPALGGSARKVADVNCQFIFGGGGLKWAGDSLVLMDQCSPGAPMGLLVFSFATGQKRCLDSPQAKELGDSGPAVSPDQKSVVFARMSTLSVMALYSVDVAGGNLRRLTFDNKCVGGAMWTSDGKRIIFYSVRSGNSRLWQVPAGGGPLELETVFQETGSLSHDGRRLAYTQWSGSPPLKVWTLKLSSPGGGVVSEKEIVNSSGEDGGADLSPDGGRIVFQSDRSGSSEIWKSQSDGSDPQQMTTFKGYAGTPRWSPDGKWIAFDFDQPVPNSQIYLMDSEGRNQDAIVSGAYDNVVPRWSNDGSSIYFASNRTGTWQVWNYKLSDGSERQVTHGGGWAAEESEDGKNLYYSRRDGGLWTMPVAGGEEKFISGDLHRNDAADFAVTTGGLYLIDAEAAPGPTIMYYNRRNSRLSPVYIPKQMLAVGGSSLSSSRDGRTVVFAQAPPGQSSIMMAEDFQ